MSVVLEFSVPAGGFRLGEVLSAHTGFRYELERIVPTGDEVFPFVWVTGEDWEAFEESVRGHAAVADLLALDTIDDRRLYRLEWDETPTDLLSAIERADGSVLRAEGDHEWVFQVRFPDHDHLSAFHDDVRERDVPVAIDRTVSMAEAQASDEGFDLTSDQREALRLALHEGYFATPRASNLDELADRLDITRQAMSKRIRRGNEKILRGVLPATGSGSNDNA